MDINVVFFSVTVYFSRNHKKAPRFSFKTAGPV